MLDPRDFLPMFPWEGPPVPEYLLKMHPFLKGSPLDIWKRFWPFPELPPERKGIYPGMAEDFYEIDQLPISQELKRQRWIDKVMKMRKDWLLTPEEETELLKWADKFNHVW